MENKPSFSLKRKFYQIFAETENPLRFNTEKTESKFRAYILQRLACDYGLEEYIPNKKSSPYGGYFEDVIRLSNNAEIKIGVSCANCYFQISVTTIEELNPMFDFFIRAIGEWW